MHVDLGEDLGIGLGPFGAELDAAAPNIVAATFQDQHHVVGSTATSASQKCFHGPRRHVGPAIFRFRGVWSTVHHQHMTTAGFRHKTHVRSGAGGAGPGDGAFHEASRCEINDDFGICSLKRSEFTIQDVALQHASAILAPLY
ncbi:hypothetical protein D9M69_603650 [compost metagenome]